MNQQKILSEEEIQVNVGLRDSVVMKSEVINFGLCARLKEIYPELRILLWT